MTQWGTWEPATPRDVARLFAGLDVPWWLAGGYAIECAVGRSLRTHEDIDILLLRRDQLAVQRALPGWEWWAADPPGELRPWQLDETLPQHVHDIWCRPGRDKPWRIQIMLDESSGQDWVSRQNAELRRPITAVGHTTSLGIPYLAPEIQLFYKAKNPRAKDEREFVGALPVLDPAQQGWLAAALIATYGDHAWLRCLDRS